jgi:lysophospholipase L1-like esterase
MQAAGIVSWARWGGRWMGTGALICLLALLLIEGLLQFATLFASDRATPWRAGATHRVLCVGDSHTWGAIVARDEAYPSHLQRFLDEREPGAYSVMNLGLPGMNTTQVRNRLPTWLSRYEPDALVVWAGVNDAFNRAELDREVNPEHMWLQALLGHSRLVRLVRVWLHDRALERYVARSNEERRWTPTPSEDPLGPSESWMVRHDGVIEEIRHDRRQSFSADQQAEVQERAERNLSLISEYARGAGIPAVVIAYPHDAGWYGVANRAIRSVATRHALPLIESAEAVARIPEDEQVWLWAAHPDGRAYDEIAGALAPVVVQALEGP